MRIGIICGGFGSERLISLKSAKSIYYALLERGHRLLCLDPLLYKKSIKNEEIFSAAEEINTTADKEYGFYWDCFNEFKEFEADIVFNALHGGEGEDGRVSAALELAGLPYTGCGHLPASVGMDKDLSKRLFRAAGGTTADWIVLEHPDAGYGDALEALGLPLVVKGNRQGSSVGLTIVEERSALTEAVEAAFAVDEKVILEKFIAGREMTVAILEGRALPVVEIAPKSGVYDFHSKYTKGASEYFAPANVPAEISDKLCNEALLAWKALNLENYARIDFRLTPEGKTYFLEANTLPGMTELSLFPMAGGAAGYDFGTVLEMIIASAKKRFTR